MFLQFYSVKQLGTKYLVFKHIHTVYIPFIRKITLKLHFRNSNQRIFQLCNKWSLEVWGNKIVLVLKNITHQLGNNNNNAFKNVSDPNGVLNFFIFVTPPTIFYSSHYFLNICTAGMSSYFSVSVISPLHPFY